MFTIPHYMWIGFGYIHALTKYFQQTAIIQCCVSFVKMSRIVYRFGEICFWEQTSTSAWCVKYSRSNMIFFSFYAPITKVSESYFTIKCFNIFARDDQDFVGFFQYYDAIHCQRHVEAWRPRPQTTLQHKNKKQLFKQINRTSVQPKRK
jgi:hypothetical protein